MCLEPTSGSGGPRKLVPYNRALRAEFRRAIAAWIVPQFMQRPDLMRGRAYWSITPQLPQTPENECEVPVGFAADSDYLGGVISRLAGGIMAVPAEVGRLNRMKDFWRATLCSLLGSADLRLISVWHPSFVQLLLAHMRENWDHLIRALHDGWSDAPGGPVIRPAPARALQLAALGPDEAGRIWPRLGLVSCWGGDATEPYLESIRSEFPQAAIQPKGLVATEAVVTIPMGVLRPLAVRSHFYEFRDDDGRIHPAWQLLEGREYTVIVTTAGGFLRYDLGDRVRVDGFVGQAPSLEFIGRVGDLSDHFGEKLESSFVSRVILDSIRECEVKAAFTMMAFEHGSRPRYSLFIEPEGPLPERLAEVVDRGLRANVHYDLCRRLGQLDSLEAVSVGCGAWAWYADRLSKEGIRLGDIKPVALSSLQGWREYLPVEHAPRRQ